MNFLHELFRDDVHGALVQVDLGWVGVGSSGKHDHRKLTTTESGEDYFNRLTEINSQSGLLNGNWMD